MPGYSISDSDYLSWAVEAYTENFELDYVDLWTFLIFAYWNISIAQFGQLCLATSLGLFIANPWNYFSKDCFSTQYLFFIFS